MFRSTSRIGRSSKTVGAFVIQVPFKELKFVIIVSFLVFKEDTPTFLFMKDMIDHGLDVFTQGRYVSLGSRHRPFSME